MDWAVGPFTRQGGPILEAIPDLGWAGKDLFNPGGVVHDGRVCLLAP